MYDPQRDNQRALQQAKEHDPDLLPILKAWSKSCKITTTNPGYYECGTYPYWYSQSSVIISRAAQSITIKDHLSRDAWRSEIKKTQQHLPAGWTLNL